MARLPRGSLWMGLAVLPLALLALAALLFSANAGKGADGMEATEERAGERAEESAEERIAWRALFEENERLQGALTTLRAARAAALEERAALEGRIAALETAAGLTEASGEGLHVVVDQLYIVDASGARQPFQRVLDEDLLLIVNELNASGAWAVAVNGQRLTARTEIRGAGAFMSINGVSCAAPFTIEALGDPATLEAGLRLQGGVLERVARYYDIDLKAVSAPEALALPAYGGVLDFQYGEGTQGEGMP